MGATMSRSTISTYTLFKMFPDQDTARGFLEKKRWPGFVQCPHCQKCDRIGKRKGGYYRCNACMEVFTVRTKTVMERSHIPLHKWIYGMYLMVTARKGISSVQLAKKIGIRQSSAWFMLKRLREACKNPRDPLCGIIEIDDYFGGSESNKHESKKPVKIKGGHMEKTIRLGMRQRKGNIRTTIIENVAKETMFREITNAVHSGRRSTPTITVGIGALAMTTTIIRP